MNEVSIRQRLLLLAAIWIGMALVLAGLAIGLLFMRTVEQNLRAELQAGTGRLAGLIDTDAASLSLSAAPGDPRYEIPFGGLYWQIDAADGTSLRSPSLWDFVLEPQLAPGQTDDFGRLAGPDGQSLAAFSRRINVTMAGTSTPYRITVAAERSVIDQSAEQFGLALALALVCLWLALMAAAYLQVRLGLAPLDGLRSTIAAMRQGRRASLAGRYPREIEPLVSEIEALLASQEDSIVYARERAADLAHGLKTPLSVLGALADTLRADGMAQRAGQLDLLSQEMLRSVEHHLQLSRLRQRVRTQSLSASIAEVVQRTLAVVEQSARGEAIDWQLALEAVRVDIDENDLMELCGVLLENAAKWARTTVRIDVRVRDGAVEMAIGDDGPGLGAEQIAALGRRGVRLDETPDGHGLGLAIAGSIVTLNGGQMMLGRSVLGGLEVLVTLPRAHAPEPSP